MDSSVYLDRYCHEPRLITESPPSELGIIVVIPCYYEPDLIRTLQSLANCNHTAGTAEVIVVINQSESAPEEIKDFNQNCLLMAKNWASAESKELSIHFINQTLPAKHAGVGLARKIGMDEAVRRFDTLKKDGIIACLDADCTVSPNYLYSLTNHFHHNPNTPGCAIYYEHELEGSLDPELYQAITAYELHLRYYTHALRYSTLPCAFQTVGSSMAVRSTAYQKQGGMNRRKAGEDFYFLQKIIKLGNFTELKNTTVSPSPRPSSRVPFGTGKAIIDILRHKELYTYNPKTFDDLKQLAGSANQLYRAHRSTVSRLWNTFSHAFQEYKPKEEFASQVEQFNQKTGNGSSFQKRFFQWCDGFFAFKFANYARENHYPEVPVDQAARWLLNHAYGITATDHQKELLLQFRDLDQKE